MRLKLDRRPWGSIKDAIEDVKIAETLTEDDIEITVPNLLKVDLKFFVRPSKRDEVMMFDKKQMNAELESCLPVTTPRNREQSRTKLVKFAKELMQGSTVSNVLQFMKHSCGSQISIKACYSCRLNWFLSRITSKGCLRNQMFQKSWTSHGSTPLTGSKFRVKVRHKRILIVLSSKCFKWECPLSTQLNPSQRLKSVRLAT